MMYQKSLALLMVYPEIGSKVSGAHPKAKYNAPGINNAT
jgi:hypothetical protein